MRRVVWTEQARDDLVAIRDYIEGFNAPAARRLAAKLLVLADGLTELVDRGRPVRRGVRELTTIPPYVMRYAVVADEVRILTIRHSARRTER